MTTIYNSVHLICVALGSYVRNKTTSLYTQRCEIAQQIRYAIPLALLLYFYGVCDALAIKYVGTLFYFHEKIRKSIVNAIVLNGVVFGASVFIFHYYIVPLLGLLFNANSEIMWCLVETCNNHTLSSSSSASIKGEGRVDENFNTDTNVYMFILLYNIFWVYPVYIFSLALNTVWYDDIARELKRLQDHNASIDTRNDSITKSVSKHYNKSQHASDTRKVEKDNNNSSSSSSSNNGSSNINSKFLQKQERYTNHHHNTLYDITHQLAEKIYTFLLFYMTMLCSMIMGWIPWIGPYIECIYWSWLCALFSIDYRWPHKIKDTLRKKIEFFESHWIYYLGFGTPLAFVSLFAASSWNSIILHSIVFPIFIITGTRCQPTKHNHNEITFLPTRLPIFRIPYLLTDQFIALCNTILYVMSVCTYYKRRSSNWISERYRVCVGAIFRFAQNNSTSNPIKQQ